MTRIRTVASVAAILFAATQTATIIDADPATTAEKKTTERKDVFETPYLNAQTSSADFTIMPKGMASFGAAAGGDWLYIIGGKTARAHHYDVESYNHTFYRLNLRDRTTWEELPGGVPLQSVALVNDEKGLVRIGGMTAVNAVGTDAELHSTDVVTRYVPETRTWVTLPSLPEKRSSHDAVVVGSKIFVFGGWDLQGDDTNATWHEHGLVFDTADSKKGWQKIDQGFQRRALALAELNQKIYVIGGMTSENKMTRKVSIYDIETGSWSDGPSIPGMAFGASAFRRGNRVFATTMDGGLFSLGDAEAEWKRERSLTLPRFFHRLIRVGDNELAAVSGTGRGGHHRTIEWLRDDRAKVTKLVIPYHGAGKARQGVFLVNNTLHVFGGNTSIRDHQFKPENFTNEGWKIELNSLRLTKIADAPVNRQSFRTFVKNAHSRFNDPVGLAFGGFGHNGDAAVSFADIYHYDILGDRWTKSTVSLPGALTQFGLAEHDKKVYVFGGLNFDPARGKKEQFKLNDSVFVWDSDAEKEEDQKKFVKLSTLPNPRRAFASATLDGKFYLVGGMKDNFMEVEPCDVYDFKTGEWSSIAAPNDFRISAQMVPLNGKLYLLGGSSQNEEGDYYRNRTVECFDPATGKWTTVVEDIGINLGEARAFALGNRILIYSAHNDQNVVNLYFIEP